MDQGLTAVRPMERPSGQCRPLKLAPRTEPRPSPEGERIAPNALPQARGCMTAPLRCSQISPDPLNMEPRTESRRSAVAVPLLRRCELPPATGSCSSWSSPAPPPSRSNSSCCPIRPGAAADSAPAAHGVWLRLPAPGDKPCGTSTTEERSCEYACRLRLPRQPSSCRPSPPVGSAPLHMTLTMRCS